MINDLGICGKCKSNNIVKNGHNNSGKQQYFCKDCKTCRIFESEKKYPESKKGEVTRTVFEGTSLRGTERIFHIARQTISEWLKKNARHSSIYRRNSHIY